jgi:uncharacterized protein (TIGR02266 family)
MSTNSVDMPFMSAEAPQNRRTDERIPARFEVHFTHEKEAAKALRAYSLNLSSGGLCLRTRKSYDVGAPVQMQMRVDSESFQLNGVVAWVREDAEAVGVRFTNLSEEDRARLQRVIDSLKR